MVKIGPPRPWGRSRGMIATMAQRWRCRRHPDADELEIEIHRTLIEPIHKLTATVRVEE